MERSFSNNITANKKQKTHQSTTGSLVAVPKDLVDVIFQEMDIADIIRVSCVCRSWKLFSLSLFPAENSKLWLIVPPGEEDSSERTDSIWDDYLGFFSLSNWETCEVETPQIYDRRICGSCPGGWLITVHENGEIQLFHPFSKAVWDLPPITKLPGVVRSYLYRKKQLRYIVPWVECGKETGMKIMDSGLVREIYIKKVIMSSSKSPSTSIVMCIQGCHNKLAFCRPGKDEKWYSVEGDGNRRFDDVTFYQGQFYAVQGSGHVFVVEDLDSFSPFVKPVISPPYKYGSEKYYLVEFNGELLLVMRFLYQHQEDPSYWKSEDFYIEVESYMTRRFEVFKLDFDGSRWVKVFDLGKDHALFVGNNQSFSLRTSDVPDCKGNCIYFTDDDPVQNTCGCPVGGFDIGVFNMESGTTEKCYPTDARVIRPPPIWFTTHQC